MNYCATCETAYDAGEKCECNKEKVYEPKTGDLRNYFKKQAHKRFCVLNKFLLERAFESMKSALEIAKEEANLDEKPSYEQLKTIDYLEVESEAIAELIADPELLERIKEECLSSIRI